MLFGSGAIQHQPNKNQRETELYQKQIPVSSP